MHWCCLACVALRSRGCMLGGQHIRGGKMEQDDDASAVGMQIRRRMMNAVSQCAHMLFNNCTIQTLSIICLYSSYSSMPMLDGKGFLWSFSKASMTVVIRHVPESWPSNPLTSNRVTRPQKQNICTSQPRFFGTWILQPIKMSYSVAGMQCTQDNSAAQMPSNEAKSTQVEHSDLAISAARMMYTSDVA